MNLGRWEIDDFLTFTCNTHDPETGAATDADAVPSYRVYEDETGTPILTGTMALLDSANTAGFYSERIQLTAASGFEVGKQYTIYISATVDSTEGTISHNLQIGVELADAADLATVDANVDAILVDTGTTLPAEHALLATAAALATHDGKLDTVDTVVDAIKAVTDNLPDSGQLLDLAAILVDTGTTLPGEHALLATAANLATLDGKVDTIDTVVDAIKAVTDLHPDAGAFTTIDANIDAILVDTGTTLPAEHALLATAASIAALNDLASSDIQTVLENNDLDHLAKVAHPTGDPVADSLFDLIMNTGAGQTFDRTTDALEAIGASSGATPAQIADAVWDEAIAGHVAAGSFGAKNQNLVPSETIGDYKADVSALALEATVAALNDITAADAADAVWDELASGHVTAGSFGDKLQNKVPSATIADYRADVSALASQASVDTIDGIVDAILVDTGTTLPAEHATLATAANLATLDGKVDTIDTVVDAIKAVTDLLPDAGALTTIDANIDAILVDTGTTLPAEHALLATAASIAALNDLSSSDVQTVLENNDLDHLLKVAHPTGLPTADSIFDLALSKDAGQNFNRSTDSLEALRDENYEGPTLQQIIDGVWDELVSAHTDAGSFGEKNQLAVPSATLNDYKADVSALSSQASVDTIDGIVDQILVDTGTTIPATLATLATAAALAVVDTNVDAVLVDTGTTIPGLIAALNDLAAADIQTVIENNDLDHLAKVAHPSGDPVADSLFDLIMNADGSQTFDRSTDALEAISAAGGGSTPAAIADAVWDELIAGHVGAGSFGAKNQNLVPSETINDYKADVSALATAAALTAHDGALSTHDAALAATDAVCDTILTNLAITDGKVETIELKMPTGYVMGSSDQASYNDEITAIKAVTDLIPDAGAMNDLAAILVDTGTSLPAEHAALATAAALAVVDSNVDAILIDTGTTLPAQISAISLDTADILDDISDLSDQLDDHDTDIKADVADVKTDTETIIATIGAIPVGAITFTYNVTNTVSGQPIADTDVWVTTDILGTNVIASGKTDQFGNVTFYLDAGTVYMWRQKSGFNFDNPDTEVVS